MTRTCVHFFLPLLSPSALRFFLPRPGKVFLNSESLTPTPPHVQLRIAYSKLGTVHLATLEPDPDGDGEGGWKVSSQGGVEEVELEMIGEDRWMGATPWALCSGASVLFP